MQTTALSVVRVKFKQELRTRQPNKSLQRLLLLAAGKRGRQACLPQEGMAYSNR